MDAEKAKPKSDWKRLKSLKAELKAQLVKDAKVQELAAALAAAVDEEDFDRCEELETQLELAKAEAERGGQAKAEREAFPSGADLEATAYPLSKGQKFVRRSWIQYEGYSLSGQKVVFSAPPPVVVNLRPGGLPDGL